jgi:predicted  nucleic acid-binding Zn-ribbon protein
MQAEPTKKSHTTAPAVSELDALQREREQLRTRMAALAAQVQQIAHEEHQATVRLADIRQKMAHADFFRNATGNHRKEESKETKETNECKEEGAF